MLIGAGLGFCGYLRFPTEERFLYGSLVLSGKVAFPDQALMLLYYRGVWSLLDQLGALAFSAGMSFTATNLAFLWMPPAFLTSALAMLAYGFTGRPVFSLLLAIICFLGGSLFLDFGSPDYPSVGLVWYAPNPHSYGRFGQLLAAFTFAALIGGREALAAFTAACLIAVHPVVGAYTFAMIAGGFGFGWLIWKRVVRRRVLLGLGAGLAITAASAGVFLITRPTMPEVDPQTNQAYLEAYASFWDSHSNQLATMTELVQVVLAAVVLALPPLALLILRHKPRTSVDVGAVALLGAIVASSLLYFMQHWAPAFLPAIVTRVIPGRLVNIQAALGMALLASMIVFARDEAARRFNSSPSDASSRPLSKLGDTILLRHPDGMAAILLVLLAIGAVPGLVSTTATDLGNAAAAARQSQQLDDDSPFWSSVREQKITGLVLVPAGLAFKALRYGHLPIALDAAGFNFVNYLPRTATTFGRIMERGYGISFFDPPASVRLFVGSLPRTAGQRYWACLSPEHWKQIAQELGIVALLVPADWAVRLPPLVRDNNYALYAMPREMSQQRPAGTAESSCGLDRE
jgi:hypothetical protein